MRALLLRATLAGSLTACGGSSTPTAPTPTTPTTWTLSGTVRAVGGGPIAAATIAILDGPDAGRQTASDAGGRYSFAGLQQAGFNVRASANGFTSVTEGVNLTADRVLDFSLPRLPVANLVFGGDIAFTLRSDGGFDMSATGTNTGDGCASSVSGLSTVTGSNGLILNYPWSLPPSLVIRPGESFRYNFGPLTRAEADALRAGATYTTRADFTSSACQ